MLCQFLITCDTVQINYKGPLRDYRNSPTISCARCLCIQTLRISYSMRIFETITTHSAEFVQAPETVGVFRQHGS